MLARRRRFWPHAFFVLAWLVPSLALEIALPRTVAAQATEPAAAHAHAQPDPASVPTTAPPPNPPPVDGTPPPPPPPSAGTYPAAAPVYPPAPAYPTVAPEQPADAYARPAPRGSYGYPALRGRLPGPGAHQHEGFFLRLNVGFGAGAASYRERVDGMQVSHVKTRGLEGVFELSIGGTVAENFILHGSVMVTAMGSHKTVDGVEDSSYDEISTSMYLVGGGATYYFMPTNIYLTLMLGVGGLAEKRAYDPRNDERDVEVDTHAGFAGALGIGKEWWVGRRGEWAIGGALMGGVYVAPIEIDGLASTFRGRSVSMTFSSTFN